MPSQTKRKKPQQAEQPTQPTQSTQPKKRNIAPLEWASPYLIYRVELGYVVRSRWEAFLYSIGLKKLEPKTVPLKITIVMAEHETVHIARMAVEEMPNAS